jgi:uncharacterized protein (TIGR03067 family)
MNAALFFTAIAIGAPALKDAKPAADIIGLWEHEQSISNGQDTAKKRDAPLRYEFRRDGTYVIYEGDKEMVGPREFRFDTKASPATLDTKTTKPKDGEATYSLAIYKVEGDRLTICKVMPGKPRPTEFETPSGSPNFIMIFRRVKKD